MAFSEKDFEYMRLALKEAEKAYKKGETPIGAVIVWEDEVIAKAHNLRESKKNALLHAECVAIDKACKKLGGWRLHKATLYVTLEPCPMCSGAIINSRIKRVVYGATDKKAGSCASVAAAVAMGYCRENELVTVKLDGGDLSVKMLPDKTVMMTGPAKTVCECEVDFL